MEGKVWHTCLHLYSTPFTAGSLAFFLPEKLNKEPRQAYNIRLFWWFEPGWDRRGKKWKAQVSDARKKTSTCRGIINLRRNGNFVFLLNPHWERRDLGFLCLLFLVSWDIMPRIGYSMFRLPGIHHHWTEDSCALERGSWWGQEREYRASWVLSLDLFTFCSTVKKQSEIQHVFLAIPLTRKRKACFWSLEEA